MNPVIIWDTALHRTGQVVAFNGTTYTVQWHKTWHVVGITAEKMASGRYTLKGAV